MQTMDASLPYPDTDSADTHKPLPTYVSMNKGMLLGLGCPTANSQEMTAREDHTNQKAVPATYCLNHADMPKLPTT